MNPDVPSLRDARLRVDLADGFRASVGGVPVRQGKEKTLALLVLLVTAVPARLTRSTLRSLLWADSSESNAQNSLRNGLWHLRTALEPLGYTGLQANRTEIWLDPQTVVTDVGRALPDLGTGHVPSLFHPDHGFPDRLLAGIVGNDLFDARIADWRRQMHHQVVETAAEVMQRLPKGQSLAFLELLFALEPLNEAHCRALMTAQLAMDRKADALATYQRLWTRLDEEFGEEPARETQRIIIDLKRQGDSLQPLDGGRPVVVLLETVGEVADSGLPILRDQTLATLARFREWRVIDQRYAPDLQRLRLESQGLVGALSLSGSRDSGVRAVLTDIGSGQIIWSERLPWPGQGRMIDLDGTVRALATAMNVHLSGPARPPAPRTDLEYERWLRAQRQMRQFNPESWTSAQSILDGILADNPGFVRALASRASIETHRHIVFPGVTSTPELHVRGLHFANLAVLADPLDSRVQLAMGWACIMARQFDRAELAFELAFQHNENDPWTITSSLIGLAFCDRLDRTRALIGYLTNLKLVIEPAHWSYLAAAHFLLGDHQSCVDTSERAEDVSADVPAWHAAALAHLGRLPEARAKADRFRSMVRAAWTGPSPPGDGEMTGWLMSCFPLRNPAAWASLRDGMAEAGLAMGSPALVPASGGQLHFTTL